MGKDAGTAALVPEQKLSKTAEKNAAAEAKAKRARTYDADEHLMSPSEVAARYGTQVDLQSPAHSAGLTAAQVEAQRAQHGFNRLTPPKELPEIVKFLKQFINPLMLLLLVAGVLCFMAYGLQPGDKRDRNNLILAGALILVVTLTCIMSYVQERSASNVMASLTKMMPTKTTVYRDGHEQKIDASELVPGDFVRLYIGDRVPADIRIVESADLKVECSSLTGESDLVPATVERKSDLVEQAHNVVFMSTLCMNGEGRGIVIRTGDHSYIGSIASLAGATTQQRSTLQAEVHRLVVFVSIIAFTSAITLFAIGLGRNNVSRIDAFINGFILVIVANVPEGLPATVTSLLTLTAVRLKERHVLIKRTDIIENLGCASIIASDKTGTLTQNRMTVENLWTNCQLFAAAMFQPPADSTAVYVPPGAEGQGAGDGKEVEMGDLSRLTRNTLNRASRRILQQASARAASLSAAGPSLHPADLMGPSLAANSQALTRGSRGMAPGFEASQSGSGRSLNVMSYGAGRTGFADPHDAGAVPLASDVLGRMSLGRSSQGFDANGRMVTRASRLATTSRGGVLGGVGVGGGLADPPGGGAVPSVTLFAEPAALEGLPVVTEGQPLQGVAALSTVSRAGRGGLSPSSSAVGASKGRMDIADFSSKQTVSWSQANALTRLVTIATVCNKARFLKAEEGAEGAVVPLTGYGAQLDQRKVAGDATDIGLLRYCDRLAPEHLVRAAHPPLFTIPFNSANKWSLVVTPAPGSPGQHVVMMKGAPEVVLTKCSHFYHNGHELVIDDGFRQSMTSAYERCGFMGERVLGFAYKTIPGQAAEQYAEEDAGPPLTGLVFMGLFSLMDPPKPNVPEAVQSCRRAGIRVAMVTGDHPLTAEAIARKVGIITLKTQREVAVELGIEEEQVPYEHPLVGAVVVNGAKLREIPEGDMTTWDAILDHEEVVFARTTPQQKLQIVEHLQRRGEIVAVTGDGVNDSPALAKAQIGVAMGIGGSDVAREAADIILLDDEFSSIVAAVEEGRVIFDNLRKTIAYTLTHALPELFPIFLNLALSFPLGLGGLLILSIDLVTEQGPAISLAYEPAEANVMLRPPRDVATERLIDGRLLRYSYLIAGVLQSAVCMIAFFSVFWWYGISVPQVAFGIDRGNFLVPDGSSSNLDTTRGVISPETQLDIYYQAQAAWYVTLVMCQFWHIWMCKTRQVSIFRHGIFRNTVTLYGCVISLVVILGIVYIHGLHSIFLTRDLIGIGWLPMLIFLLIMLPFTEWSKWRTRLHPEGFVSRYVQW